MAAIRLQNSFGDSHIHYEFDPTKKPLGEGGMGRVFRGVQVDESADNRRTREVAIKLLFDDLPQHAIERARREAKVRIKNAHLVEMIDFVEYRDEYTHSVHYHVVSEFLNGVNLDEMLEGRLTNHDGSRNPTAERLFNTYSNNRKAFVGEVFRSILSGIMALHDAGYIHRDIDPSNIMVTSEGKIKLIDFGIAKKTNELGTNDKQLTSAGQFVGKTHYAAPELLLGDLKHQDCTTDIYSLGITLFQLITGHLPFDGSFQEVYEKQLQAKMPLKEVEDKTVRKIMERATEKDQKKRYQSASEFRVDIDKWMATDHGNDGERRATLDIKIPKPTPVFKKIAIAMASVVVIVLAAVLIGRNLPPKQGSDIPPASPTLEEDSIKSKKEKKAAKKPTLDECSGLILSGNMDGIENLKLLADNGDHEAAFLLSRIYFDPSTVAKEGAGFYNEEWTTMRNKCGISTDNAKAHDYLLKAYRTVEGKKDPVLLYELGCDFMYEGRGAAKDWGKARTCFEMVDSLVIGDSPYKDAVASRLRRIGKTTAKPIE